jgi:hypothetical protein
MNTERLNDWLTLLANIGVVIGLVIIIIEVRESNLQATSATTMARYTEIETSNRDFAMSDHLPAIYVQVETSGVESLDAEQLSRIQSWEMARILRMEGQFVQYQAGYLTESNYKIMLDVAREIEPLWKELNIQSRNTDFLKALERDDDV